MQSSPSKGKWLGFYFEPCWTASKTPAIPAASLQLKPDLWPPLRVDCPAEISQVDKVEAMKCSHSAWFSWLDCVDLFSTFRLHLSYPLSSWAHPWSSWAPWNQTGKASSISGPKSPLTFAPTCTQSRLVGSRLETTQREKTDKSWRQKIQERLMQQ